MFEYLVKLLSETIQLAINLIKKERELIELLDTAENWEGCGCAPDRRCTCSTPTLEDSSSITISFDDDALSDVDSLPQDEESFLDVSDFISNSESSSQFEYTSSDDVTSLGALSDDEESDDSDLDECQDLTFESSDSDDEESSRKVVLSSVVAPPAHTLPMPKWVQDPEDRLQSQECDILDIYDDPQPGPSHVLDPRAAAKDEWDTYEFSSSEDESFAHLSNSETESADEEFLDDFVRVNEPDREPAAGAVSPKELKNWIRASMPEVTMPTNDIKFPISDDLFDPIHLTWPASKDSIWSSTRLNETLARENVLNYELKPGEDPVSLFFRHFEVGTIPPPSRW